MEKYKYYLIGGGIGIALLIFMNARTGRGLFGGRNQKYSKKRKELKR